MDRRKFLHLVSGLGVGLLGMGHSPYRQWFVYRRVRLFILTSAAEAPSYPLGEAVAALLAAHLPESRAMAARARDSVEIVKLLASEQLDVALLTPGDARAALEGTGPFAEEGPLRLRALAALGSHLLVCRDDLPGAKAYDIARTLAEHGRTLPIPVPDPVPAGAPALPIPLHAAVLDYFEGRAPAR
jgi:TRAP-type uncharacterized transport system substrate-binding protein